MKRRGIYHAHSRYSGDGHYTLPEIKELLRARGLDFIIMTEHAEDMTPESLHAYVEECSALSDHEILIVPGLEVPYVGKVHVGCFPVTSTPEVPLYAEGIRALHDVGATTVIHHPSKQGYFMDDTLPSLIDYVEVWNARYEGRVAPSRETLAFARAAYPGKPYAGGFDLHTPAQLTGPLIEVELSELTVSALHATWKSGALTVAGDVFSFPASGIRGITEVEYHIMRTLYEGVRSLLRVVNR